MVTVSQSSFFSHLMQSCQYSGGSKNRKGNCRIHSWYPGRTSHIHFLVMVLYVVPKSTVTTRFCL